MATQKHIVTIDGKRLSLSNLDKVLYPADGYTKGQMIDYYVRIAPVMLPHLRHRPITLKRYPDGVTGSFFFEKNCPRHRPSWMDTATITYPNDGKTIRHCLLNSRAALVWAANLAALELHTSLALANAIEQPTMIAFDLDPGEPAALPDCLRIGLRLRAMLEHLGLRCFPKTSGGKGLHVYVPLNTPTDYEASKNFAYAVALMLEKQDNDVTSNMSKAKRRGKVFVDWSQNSVHKTTVCVYSLRAQPHPTASAPATWAEVEHALNTNTAHDLILHPDALLHRVEQQGDLFADVLKLKQKLPKFTD